MSPDDVHAAAAAPQRAATPADDIDLAAIDTIRTLAIDAVEKADSGHAGLPMGMAPVGYTLWRQFLRYDPDAPLWPNRDRFVLSAGHGSLLLYALLFLAGVKRLKDGKVEDRLAVSLEDIKDFRELDSITAGHPEHELTTGVETTTGPLGQGVGNSVGMAIAERWLAARYNKPDHAIVDYDVYAICSDGDLMEGISGEAASLAGHLRLSNLCWIYDDNSVTIEGSTEIAFTEDICQRFRGYGWATLRVDDANDCAAVARALETFKATADRPTLIRVKSVIGYGSPHKAGTSKAHSRPAGRRGSEADQARLRLAAGRAVPGCRTGCRRAWTPASRCAARKLHADWEAALAKYAAAYPDEARQLKQMPARELPDGWEDALPSFAPDAKGIATREASGKVLQGHRTEDPLAGGRLGRPRPLPLHQDPPGLR